ncbi:MAG: glycoside hydrolase family 9, partial [Chitinophagaceae bacterium]|nr:glycoside hydrolase family 9 [Chitinophagaceae bacterium]
NHYSYEDPASTGVTYYRLKQVDINGNFSWSKINVINNSMLTGSAYSVHPNPSSDAFQIRSVSDAATPSSIRITDARGVLVLQQEHLFNGSALTVGQSLAKGLYVLEITSTTDRFVMKLIKE